MSLSQLTLILRARWRSAFIVFVLVVGLVVAFTLTQSKTYTATAAVVLDVKSPDPIAGIVLPGMNVSGYMATQVDILQSERVMLRAIRALHIDEDAHFRAAWQQQTEGRGNFNAWLADGLGKKLDARPGKDSNVILVSYTSRDPHLAARIANAIVKSYIETTLELRTEPAKQFNALFDESTKELRESLEVAQTRLSKFQQKKGIVATDERLDIENARLSELSTQLVELQAVANDSRSRQNQASRMADQMSEIVSNPMVVSLTSDLSRQEARLNEISERFGPQHPQVQELRASIKQMRDRLALEKSRITGSLTANNSVNQARLENLRNALDAQRNKVLQMRGLRDEAAVLQRDVENAQKVYDAGFGKLSQSTLESQATQTNVSVVKVATEPPFPSSPRVMLNLTVGLLLGLVLSIATAALREVRDWRLRSEADVTDTMKLPLLGVVPDRRSGKLPREARSLRAVAERVLGRPSLIGN
ncbi:MAG: chain length determinant protein EpsF [Burkholderiaceae bacterium]|nr:chain length determinant protein EpsF [Burkholderiaceae bacterium]